MAGVNEVIAGDTACPRPGQLNRGGGGGGAAPVVRSSTKQSGEEGICLPV